jgi:dihydroorotate dehydrogenase (fumarate)
MLVGITGWMEAREYASVAQLKGSMSQQNLPEPQRLRPGGLPARADSFTPPPGVRY